MNNEEIKNVVSRAKNIVVIPSPEPESLSAALALFYTLKDLDKNVNLLVDQVPKKLQFLIPSLDFISTPQNFVISIPRTLADVSQIYYEKTPENVKIHVTVDHGRLKKDHISFYATDVKPDLVITLGISNFREHLEQKLDESGYLLGAPVVAMAETPSLSEATLEMVQSIQGKPLTTPTANCLLASLMLHYENFTSSATTPEAFQMAAALVKQGAQHQVIVGELSKASDQELQFLRNIFEHLTIPKINGWKEKIPIVNGVDDNTYVAVLDNHDFGNLSEREAKDAIEKIRAMGLRSDMLVLWKSQNSAPVIKGFFHSAKAHMINKFAEYEHATIHNGWVFFQIPGENIEEAKNELLKKI